MKPVFVDTGAWYALMNRHDAHHEAAAGFLAECSRPLISTNYVAVETVNLLNARAGHGAALRFLELVSASGMLTVHHVSTEDHARAQAYFKRHADKDWSLTDCSSFQVMQALGITEAFTFDKHFYQAGFSRVP